MSFLERAKRQAEEVIGEVGEKQAAERTGNREPQAEREPERGGAATPEVTVRR